MREIVKHVAAWVCVTAFATSVGLAHARAADLEEESLGERAVVVVEEGTYDGGNSAEERSAVDESGPTEETSDTAEDHSESLPAQGGDGDQDEPTDNKQDGEPAEGQENDGTEDEEGEPSGEQSTDEQDGESTDEQEDGGTAPYTETTVSYSTGGTAVVESYISATETQDVTIKPCDVILVVDQSKWMNGSREEIVEELNDLVGDLATPTYGEHRIAIAGYGRVNMGAGTDPYDATEYPGTPASGNGISLNTGYYTASGFVSSNGWTDVAQNAMTTDQLPQMPSTYVNVMEYDSAFMTVEEAESVLTTGGMMSWYAGASRLDAGLTVAERLAELAGAKTADRNLIVVIAASSLPIQNTPVDDRSTIRTLAVLNAAQRLKDMGATIYVLGDYHASGKTISGEVQDTEQVFDDTMRQVGTYWSFAQTGGATAALNAMNTEIVTNVASGATQDYKVTAADCGGQDWGSALGTGALQAKAEYFYLAGYDGNGDPVFEDDPYVETEVDVESLFTDGAFSYTAKLIPVYGDRGGKVRVTISSAEVPEQSGGGSAEPTDPDAGDEGDDAPEQGADGDGSEDNGDGSEDNGDEDNGGDDESDGDNETGDNDSDNGTGDGDDDSDNETGGDNSDNDTGDNETGDTDDDNETGDGGDVDEDGGEQDGSSDDAQDGPAVEEPDDDKAVDAGQSEAPVAPAPAPDTDADADEAVDDVPASDETPEQSADSQEAPAATQDQQADMPKTADATDPVTPLALGFSGTVMLAAGLFVAGRARKRA